MYKNKSIYLNANGKVYILILVILISLLLTSCSTNTAVNTKPWGQNPKEAPNVIPITSNSVWSVAFSPGNKTIIAGCINNQIYVWDVETGKLLKLLETVTPDMLPTKLNEIKFNNVFLSPDGKTAVNVLMYHPRGTMKVWDIQEGKFLYTLKGHEHWIRYVVFSPDSRIMASGGAVDIAISLWDVKTGRSLGILEEMGWTLSLAFSADGKLLAAGDSTSPSDNESILVGDKPHERIYSKEYIGPINIWDVQTRDLLWKLSGHVKGVGCVAFSPDSKILASGGWDGTFYLWDVQTGKKIRALEDTGGLVMLSVAFSPDGKTFATGGWDGIVRLWDTETGVLLKKMRQSFFPPGAVGSVRSVAFSPDGEKLAAGILDGNVIIWDVKTGKRLRTLKTSAEHPNQIYRRRPEQALLENERDHQ
jgi:WD40 repeat protein